MSAITDFKASISKRFHMKDLGQVHNLLGLVIKQDLVNGTVHISQQHYIDELLGRFGMQEAWPLLTPAERNVVLTLSMAPATPAEISAMAITPYRELVEALLYVAVMTRPDLSNAVRALTRFCDNPGPRHWRAAQHVLKHLKGTRGKGLLYRRDAPTTSGATVGYVDANWARNLDNRRSIGAHIFLQSGAAISWRSKLQDCMVAAAHAAQHAVWLRRLADCLGLEVSSAALLQEDNRSCIVLANNVFSEHRVKHIDIKFYIVRERVASGAITLVPTKAANQLADLLTKPL
ncbi:unnamed protein product, partial [Phaeothamnion confervicola]